MASSLRLTLVAGSIVLVSTLLLTSRAKVTLPTDASEVSPELFAGLATAVVMPIYPQESIRNGSSGVAVALVALDSAGRVRWVEVLEAPDAAIGNSVRSALAQWVFQPPRVEDSNTSLEVRGRVILYFVVDDGKRVVLTAEQAGARRAANGRLRRGTPPE